MLKGTLGCLLLIACLAASGGDSWGWSSQRDAVCQGSCGGGCGPCGSGGNRNSGPSAQDLREQAADEIDDQGRAAMANGDYEQALAYFEEAYQRSELERYAKYYRRDIAWAKGAIANRNGVAAADRKDFAAALAFFQQAADFVPDAEGYQKQVAWAKGAILDEQAYQANASGDYKKAAKLYREAVETLPDPPADYRKFVEEYQKKASRQDKITRTLSHIAETVEARPVKSAAGLDFACGDESHCQQQTGSSGLDFNDVITDQEGPRKTGLFGTTSNPLHPDLGAAAAPGIDVRSNREHLSSDAKSGADAQKAGKPEDAKGLAGSGFDDKSSRAPDAIAIEKSVVQTPAATDLRSHIPVALRQDAEINSALVWYEKLERSQAANTVEIGEVRKQIAAPGAGDSVVLKARLAELENRNRQQQVDEEKITTQLKKRVFDLKMTWIETPQPGKEGAPSAQPAK
jgi:tetratricopeptide (TPR) repeat protein